MGKFTLLAALLMSLLSPQNTSVQRADRDYDALTGPVRVVRIEYERLPDERPKGAKQERELEEIVTYDAAGRIKEQIEFGSHPALCTRVKRTYGYDESGNRVETISWSKGVPGGVPDAVSESLLRYRQSFTYDALGRWTKVNDYDESGQLYSETTYKYDEKGRVSTRAAGGSSCLFKYNAEGFIAEESCERRYAGSETKDINTFTYEVDTRGNWIKRIERSSAIIDGRRVHQSGRITHRSIEYASAGGVETAAGVGGAGGSELAKVSACPPMIVRKSGGALQQSAIRRVSPRYPEEARGKRVSGEVVVEVTTDEAGKVVSVRTFSGPTELRRAAEEAARQWEFKPTVLSKIPIKVVGTITFSFTL